MGVFAVHLASFDPRALGDHDPTAFGDVAPCAGKNATQIIPRWSRLHDRGAVAEADLI